MEKRIFSGGSTLGSSNYTGFRIYDDIAEIETKTKNYNSFSFLEKIAKTLTIFIITGFMFFAFKIGDTVMHKLLACFLSLVFIKHIALPIISPKIYNVILRGKRRKDTLEWHAAEHKIINILRTAGNSREIIMPNLKRASMFSPFCGDGNLLLVEPSEDKLKEALRAGRIFCRKMGKIDKSIYYIRLVIYKKSCKELKIKRSGTPFFLAKQSFFV